MRIEDGETITKRADRDVVLLADRPELTITWSRYVAGDRGPSLHVHREHTDAFYVLEGELTFEVGPGGAERITLGPGGFVAVPPNVVHTYVSRTDATWLNVHAPDMGFAASMRGMRDGTARDWDSFDAPGDGGRPAAEAIVRGPDEGERLSADGRTVLLKGAMPELCVAEWAQAPPGVPHGFAYERDGRPRVVDVRAPDGGFAEALRRG